MIFYILVFVPFFVERLMSLFSAAKIKPVNFFSKITSASVPCKRSVGFQLTHFSKFLGILFFCLDLFELLF